MRRGSDSIVSPYAAAVGAAAHPEPARAARGAVEEAWTYLPERVKAVEADRARCLDMRRDPELVREIDDHPLQCLLPEGAEDLDDYLGDGPTGPLDEVVAAGPLARMGASGLLEAMVDSLESIESAYDTASQCAAPRRLSRPWDWRHGRSWRRDSPRSTSAGTVNVF